MINGGPSEGARPRAITLRKKKREKEKICDLLKSLNKTKKFQSLHRLQTSRPEDTTSSSDIVITRRRRCLFSP